MRTIREHQLEYCCSMCVLIACRIIAHFPSCGQARPHDFPCATKIRCQTACKPGSVPPGEPEGDGHSSRARLAAGLVQPTRTAARKHALSPVRQTRRPYSVLLPVRFSVPCPSLGTRCALTAPFHPYRRARKRAGGPFSVALSLGSPPPGVTRHRVSVEPGLSSPKACALAAAIRPSGTAGT